jgi:hypothetical protein
MFSAPPAAFVAEIWAGVVRRGTIAKSGAGTFVPRCIAKFRGISHFVGF